MTWHQAERVIALLESIDARLARLTFTESINEKGDARDVLRVRVDGTVEVEGDVTAHDPR